MENWESQHHSVTVELTFLVNVKIPCGWLCAERTRLHLNTLWMHHLFVWTRWDCSPNTYCLFHHGRPKLAPAQCTYLLIFVQICCSYLFVWKLLYKSDLCRIPGAYSASRPLWTSKEFILKWSLVRMMEERQKGLIWKYNVVCTTTLNENMCVCEYSAGYIPWI